MTLTLVLRCYNCPCSTFLCLDLTDSKNVAYFYENEWSAATGYKWLGGEWRVRLVARYAPFTRDSRPYCPLFALFPLGACYHGLIQQTIALFESLGIFDASLMHDGNSNLTRGTLWRDFSQGCRDTRCLFAWHDLRTSISEARLREYIGKDRSLFRSRSAKRRDIDENFQKIQTISNNFWANKIISGHDIHEGMGYHTSSIILLAWKIS
jgi:hypothetical protein